VIVGRPQQAVHVGGNDRQPPCGAFLLSYNNKVNKPFCLNYFIRQDKSKCLSFALFVPLCITLTNTIFGRIAALAIGVAYC